MGLNIIFKNILDAHFGTVPERPLDPPEDKNADRLAAIRDQIEELEREYEYIASGDEEEDLRTEAMELLNDNELAVTAL